MSVPGTLPEPRPAPTADGPGRWLVEADLPAQVLSDGVQTLLLKTAAGPGPGFRPNRKRRAAST